MTEAVRGDTFIQSTKIIYNFKTKQQQKTSAKAKIKQTYTFSFNEIIMHRKGTEIFLNDSMLLI